VADGHEASAHQATQTILRNTTGATWAPIVPRSARSLATSHKGPLVPDYYPGNPERGAPIFDFASYVDSLPADAAASLTRHRNMELHNTEVQVQGRTRQLAHMIGHESMEQASPSHKDIG